MVSTCQIGTKTACFINLWLFVTLVVVIIVEYHNIPLQYNSELINCDILHYGFCCPAYAGLCQSLMHKLMIRGYDKIVTQTSIQLVLL